MTAPRFDMTINLGHIIIVVGMAVSVLFAYTDVLRQLDNHEFRIERAENRFDRDSSKLDMILSTVTNMREDIATLKATQRRDDGR